MIVVFERHETEGLQNSGGRFPHRAENFRHAADGSGLRLECDFGKGALRQRIAQMQQSAGCGNGSKFSSSAVAVF
jgi:hypothetical protein